VKRILLATLAATALGTSFVAPASAAQPSDTDLLCGFTSATDPNPEAPADTQTGELDGGPIAQNGTITCTIQVTGARHADPDNGAKASATGNNGVTVLNPTLISYTSPENSNVYLCDQFTDSAGVVWVWDDTPTPTVDDPARGWVKLTDFPNALCRLAISASSGQFTDIIFDLLDPVEALIDQLACGELAALGQADVALPPLVYIDDEGDIFIDVDLNGPNDDGSDMVWDCPIYLANGDASDAAGAFD